MKRFRVKGWFKRGFEKQVFTKEFPATSKETALEKIYAEVGSKHKVKRNQVKIEEIIELQE